jgi:nucleoid DNA-binding protein
MDRLPVADMIAAIAERSGVREADVRSVLRSQAAVAYEHAHAGKAVAIPGIGVLEAAQRPGRKMVMAVGMRKGESITVPPYRRLIFLFGLAAKHAILGGEAPTTDVLEMDAFNVDPADEDGSNE